MTTATIGQMTAAEFFGWAHRPETRDRHFELERARVVEMSRPGERHGFVCGNSTSDKRQPKERAYNES